MANIFKDATFYMTPGPNKAKITDLITEHGGTMAKHSGSNVILLLDLANTAVVPKSQWPLFSTKLIEDSVAQGRFLNPKGFEIKLRDVAFNPKDRAALRAPYSPEEDLILMKYFHEHEGKNSINFFNEMQQKGILQRSGESMKNRFKFLKSQAEGYFAELEKKSASLKENENRRMPKAVQEAPEVPNQLTSPVEVDNSEIASRIIENLQQRTGLPVEVVYHSLLIFSGNVTKAHAYLTKEDTSGAWSIVEDNIIQDEDEEPVENEKMSDGENGGELKSEALQELSRYRSKAEISNRARFLKHVPNLLN